MSVQNELCMHAKIKCMCTHAEQLLTMGTTCVADITEKSRFRK